MALCLDTIEIRISKQFMKWKRFLYDEGEIEKNRYIMNVPQDDLNTAV